MSNRQPDRQQPSPVREPAPVRARSEGPAITPTQGSVLALQRTLGNRGTIAFLQRHAAGHKLAPKPSTEQQVVDLDRRQKILQKRQDANEQDRNAHSKFTKRLANYREASARIAAAFDTATTNFSSAQIAQAQSDALAAQLLGLAVAVGFAGAFEWFFAGALGALGRSAESVAKSIERLENPANALVSGGVNVAGVLVAAGSAAGGQTPAGPTQGGPVAYLARNLEAIAHHEGAFETAFQARSEQLGKGTDEDWEKFDPARQQQFYDAAFARLDAAGATVDKLPGENQIALVVERQLWALWIKANTDHVFTQRDQHDTNKNRPVPKPGEAKVEDIESVRLAIGADREVRLNAVGVSSRAGVKLTGSSFTFNSPDNYRDLLWVWAQNHSERIA
jgi:hypothetical protein